ncbi:MAG: hypothetical protein AB4038_16180 [Prochloraceae cyanobacterium]
MTNSDIVDETRIKALFKESIVEVIEENQELVSSILVNALEDIELSRAIEEGEQSTTVSREQVFQRICLDSIEKCPRNFRTHEFFPRV